MKIVKLNAENVKRLRAVEIEPDGSLVIIGGKNAQGKSSVLDSIMYALGGGGSMPEKALRDGENKGEVTVRLDNGLAVTRNFTGKGSHLKVKAADGAAYPSPQKMLDGLVGRLSFDPLAFTTMAPREQLIMLKDLVGLDFTGLDETRKKLYDSRTDIGRDVAKAKANLSSMAPIVSDAPEEEVSITDLMDELTRRQNVNHANKMARVELSIAIEKRDSIKNRISDLKADLAEAESQYMALKANTSKLTDEDEQEISTQINKAEDTNRAVRSNALRNNTEADYALNMDSYDKLTKSIEVIDKDKTKQIQAAKFPVDGLAFGADSVLYNNIPYSQASTAEQIRVSVAMGIAANPKLKVLLIRDGSHLDDDNLKLIAEMAEKHDAQVWLERVGKGDEVSVIIEDGMIAQPLAAARSRKG